MDPLGYYFFSREEPIGKTAHDALASKKQDVSTNFAFPPASSDALSTASAIAGILHGHYNADGTRRANHGDVLQMNSTACGYQLQQQLSCANVAGVSSHAVRADDVISSVSSQDQVDELSILRSLMKFDESLTVGIRMTCSSCH